MENPAPEATPAPETTNKVVDAVKNALQNNIVQMALMVGIAVAAVTGFWIYWLVTRVGSLRKKGYEVIETRKPLLGTESTVISADIPSLDKNKAMTMSFWIYIHDFNMYAGSPRRVLHRGDATDTSDPTAIGPYVYIDGNSNKLHVVLKPKNTYDNIPGISSASEEIKQQYQLLARGITIDYIPVKRWVHVIITVDHASNSISAFLDGELVKTRKGMDVKKLMVGTVEQKVDLLIKRDTDIMGTGDLHIGGNPATGTLGFAGLFAGLKFFTFEMTKREVYAEYRKGPIPGLLAKMGLPSYGVQTPIYKLGQ
jgi:hypothetical protein